MNDKVMAFQMALLAQERIIDLPVIKIASTGQLLDTIEASGTKGMLTLTLRPRITEDADFEIMEPKQLSLTT